MEIRHATSDDLPGIYEIRTHAILETAALWTEVASELTALQNWYDERVASDLPVLVAIDDSNQVIGFASYGRFRWPYDGFEFTVENSVYVRKDRYGEGIASALMNVLIDHAKERDKKVMFAAIDSENEPSIKLHEKLGFEHAGRYRHIGKKFGEFRTMITMELILNNNPVPPPSAVPTLKKPASPAA